MQAVVKDQFLIEPLAQSVEHLTFNQVVVGSTPTRLTKKSGVSGNTATPFFVSHGLTAHLPLYQAGRLLDIIRIRKKKYTEQKKVLTKIKSYSIS